MALFYSAALAAFFDDAIHADLPHDAQPVTRARHRDLLDAQATGAAIVAADDGTPRILRPRILLEDRRAALVRAVKREAGRRIDAIAPIWRQLNDSRAPSAAGMARFSAIDAIRAASDLIERQIGDASATALRALDIANHPAWPAE